MAFVVKSFCALIFTGCKSNPAHCPFKNMSLHCLNRMRNFLINLVSRYNRFDKRDSTYVLQNWHIILYCIAKRDMPLIILFNCSYLPDTGNKKSRTIQRLYFVC
jgi:hypothetical protein